MENKLRNKTLLVCCLLTIVCGIIILVLSLTDSDVSTYAKIIGPLQIVVGFLFLIIGKQGKK